MGLDKAQVSGDNASHGENDDVPSDQFLGGNLMQDAFADDGRPLRFALPERLKGARCPAFLHDADNDVHEKRYEDHERVRIMADEYRPESGKKKNEGYGARELAQGAGKDRVAERFRQTILPERETSCGFALGKSGNGISMQVLCRLLYRPRVPVLSVHFLSSITDGVRSA